MAGASNREHPHGCLTQPVRGDSRHGTEPTADIVPARYRTGREGDVLQAEIALLLSRDFERVGGAESRAKRERADARAPFRSSSAGEVS
jgi:hypothetical protein